MQTFHKNIRPDSLRARTSYRDRIDLLRSRVGLLTGKDKLLMTMYLNNGNSFRQMARLIGVNEGTVARRIRKVTKRLLDGEYVTCLRHREKFTGIELAIAREHFLAGMSIREIAARRKTTYYNIHATIKKVRRIIRTTDEHGAEQPRQSVCQSA